jgi:hypothetical protein
MARNVPGQTGKRQYGNREKYRSTRDAMSGTVASYAISDEQRATKKVLDNRHHPRQQQKNLSALV